MDLFFFSKWYSDQRKSMIKKYDKKYDKKKI